MATKSFLTNEAFEEARRKLEAPPEPPDGDESVGVDLGARGFSAFLAEKLLARLSKHPDWRKTLPVALGSWARGDLSPKSDIDLLLCGSEDSVRRLVDDFSREGLKLRYRMPEDPADWTVGVEPFDVLALLAAVPLVPDAEAPLAAQRELLKIKNRKFRGELLKAMRSERAARAERYDSISNFLEPNIKFGPGGLRDLEQALVARRLFPDRFEGAGHAFQVLEYYKSFFLLTRAKLHLSDGGGDVLSAPEQRPISEWLGYRDVKDFMREVQKGVSRVSFYADWAIAQASCSEAKRKAIESFSLKSIDLLFRALEREPSILMQNRVRLVADSVFKHERASRSPKAADKKIGQWLTRFLDPLEPEGPMVALFRSRLIDHVVPEFPRIVGHVQHDQYHRFSVDAHLLQVLRELKRLCARPKRAGRLAPLIRGLKPAEREALALACLYHDLAKGRGGDHSIKGVELAERDLKRFGKSAALIAEVSWLVAEHLGLSAAAFRENPRSPRTWQSLAERGVKGRRIPLLAIFTVVDILGTNPEAWTSWKERLLAELVEQLERPETDRLLGLAEALKKSRIKGWERYLETLDPFLVSSVPPNVLAADLGSGLGAKAAAEPLVVQPKRTNQTWVRFRTAEDRPGLFLSFVKRLSSSGLGVRHASILTDSELGVYDWFEVKSTKTPEQITRLLAAPDRAVDKVFAVNFDSIEMVSRENSEWVVSFRGRDQNGALTEAARALFELGAEVRWAKVHTWGRQIDDVFGIKPLPEGPEKLVSELYRRLVK